MTHLNRVGPTLDYDDDRDKYTLANVKKLRKEQNLSHAATYEFFAQSKPRKNCVVQGTSANKEKGSGERLIETASEPGCRKRLGVNGAERSWKFEARTYTKCSGSVKVW